MTDYTVRLYQEHDLGRLYEIDRICFPADMAYSRAELRFYIHHPGSIVRVAEMECEVVGFVAGLVRGDKTGHVITLDVVPPVRRRGIGSTLMSALHEEFLCRNVRLAILEVSAEDLTARRFYENIDYEYSEVLPGYYNRRIDACRMVRWFEPALDRAYRAFAR